jgi:hypothetical protein
VPYSTEEFIEPVRKAFEPLQILKLTEPMRIGQHSDRFGLKLLLSLANPSGYCQEGNVIFFTSYIIASVIPRRDQS